MYEVTYSLNGVIKTIMISANDSVQVHEIITNMFGAGNVQITNIVRR